MGWDEGKVAILTDLQDLESLLVQLSRKQAGWSDKSATGSDDEKMDLTSRFHQRLGDCRKHLQNIGKFAATPLQKIQLEKFTSRVRDCEVEFQRMSMSSKRVSPSGIGRSGDDVDDDTDTLLRENESLDKALSGLDTLIESASMTNARLKEDAARTASVGGKIGAIAAKLPGISGLLTDIERAEVKQELCVGAVIGLCVCFCLWWVAG